jgi:hypothetical protein
MDTLLLDTVLWDLVADTSGNIAAASTPYSQAQDAASEILTFQGEVYYDTTQGLPYFQSILGKFPPVSLMKQQFAQAAENVPGVVSAIFYISSLTQRLLQGQVQITNTEGETQPFNIGLPLNAGPNVNT